MPSMSARRLRATATHRDGIKLRLGTRSRRGNPHRTEAQHLRCDSKRIVTPVLNHVVVHFSSSFDSGDSVMAAHFDPRKVLRQLSKPLLRQLFSGPFELASVQWDLLFETEVTS